MDDTISRQAAIDFIDAGHLCNPNEPRWSDNEVVNFLKTRPPAQRWIPCRERQPEHSGVYLVTQAPFRYMDVPFVDIAYYSAVEKEWKVDLYAVLAWAERPEPWEREDEG